MKNIIFVASLVFCCFFWNKSVAQQLDPIHYPPESEWEYLITKNTDSLIQVMKFYFLSDDTLFFREAVSQQVVKVSVKDLQRTSIYIGQDYAFANRFYGPKGANASRTSKNEKLDRFYYYYLNAPELKFSKTASLLSIEQTEMALTDSTAARQETLPVTSIPVQNTKPRSVLRPQIVLKNGGILYPENFYFLSDEAGFITKTGCKIIPSAYYCLSDGRYYFAVGDKKNYFYLDTNEVLQYQNMDLGKDQRFSVKKRAGFARRFWVGTVIVGGPLAVALGAGGFFLIGVAANDPYDGGLFFGGGLAICTAIFYKVLKSAIINVREHDAYQKAQHYVCI